LTCSFAFKLCHDGIVDVERGLHTETHIIDMGIWLGTLIPLVGVSPPSLLLAKGKDVAKGTLVKTYVVRLSGEERWQLETLIFASRTILII